MKKKAKKKKGKKEKKPKAEWQDADEDVILSIAETWNDKPFTDDDMIAEANKIRTDEKSAKIYDWFYAHGTDIYRSREKRAPKLTKKSKFLTPLGLMSLNTEYEVAGEAIVKEMFSDKYLVPKDLQGPVLLEFAAHHIYLIGYYSFMRSLVLDGAFQTEKKPEEAALFMTDIIDNTVAFVRCVLDAGSYLLNTDGEA